MAVGGPHEREQRGLALVFHALPLLVRARAFDLRDGARRRPRRAIHAARPRTALFAHTRGFWATVIVASLVLGGRTALGTLLTGAFVLQVTPSIWTAYRVEQPTGVARGTWLLVLGELTCWLTFGVHRSDPRLIALGASGVTAAALMLARIEVARRRGMPPVTGCASSDA